MTYMTYEIIMFTITSRRIIVYGTKKLMDKGIFGSGEKYSSVLLWLLQ